MRDLFQNFKNMRQRAQSRNSTKKNDPNDLRERFKPLNNKFGKKKPKQKIGGDEEAEFKQLRSSSLSDENTGRSEIYDDHCFDQEKGK